MKALWRLARRPNYSGALYKVNRSDKLLGALQGAQGLSTNSLSLRMRTDNVEDDVTVEMVLCVTS